MHTPRNDTNRATHAAPSRRRRHAAAMAATAAGLTLLAACGPATAPATDAGAAASNACSTTLAVTASVSQWGALARELGGPCVAVTSLIDSSAADPHDYEPTPADLAALAQADIVVLNGAGYDGWASGAQFDEERQTVISIGELMGVDGEDHDDAPGDHGGHDHGTSNPHLWFSPEAVKTAAQAIGDAYLERVADDGDAATLTGLVDDWNDDYAEFAALLDQGRAQGAARGYVATESIIGHLLDAIGAEDHTPQAYTNAVNSEAEPSAADLKAATEAVADADVDFLVTNPQEVTGFAEQLAQAAETAGKPVVAVGEQLPADQETLLGWLTSITEQILAVGAE